MHVCANAPSQRVGINVKCAPRDCSGPDLPHQRGEFTGCWGEWQWDWMQSVKSKTKPITASKIRADNTEGGGWFWANLLLIFLRGAVPVPRGAVKYDNCRLFFNKKRQVRVTTRPPAFMNCRRKHTWQQKKPQQLSGPHYKPEHLVSASRLAKIHSELQHKRKKVVVV